MLCLIFPDEIKEEKNIFNQTLGRDKDPKIESDITKLQLYYRKSAWTILTFPGLRFLTNIIYPKSTISHFNIKEKIVAFTIDDGFYGIDNPNGSMIDEVTDLFSKFKEQISSSNSVPYTTSELRRLRGLRAVILHYVFGWSWTKIGEKYKLQLLCDHIHLNERGGDLMEQLAKEFLSS